MQESRPPAKHDFSSPKFPHLLITLSDHISAPVEPIMIGFPHSDPVLNPVLGVPDASRGGRRRRMIIVIHELPLLLSQ
jgi:hypothetical protein